MSERLLNQGLTNLLRMLQPTFDRIIQHYRNSSEQVEQWENTEVLAKIKVYDVTSIKIMYVVEELHLKSNVESADHFFDRAEGSVYLDKTIATKKQNTALATAVFALLSPVRDKSRMPAIFQQIIECQNSTKVNEVLSDNGITHIDAYEPAAQARDDTQESNEKVAENDDEDAVTIGVVTPQSVQALPSFVSTGEKEDGDEEIDNHIEYKKNEGSDRFEKNEDFVTPADTTSGRQASLTSFTNFENKIEQPPLSNKPRFAIGEEKGDTASHQQEQTSRTDDATRRAIFDEGEHNTKEEKSGVEEQKQNTYREPVYPDRSDKFFHWPQASSPRGYTDWAALERVAGKYCQPLHQQDLDRMADAETATPWIQEIPTIDFVNSDPVLEDDIAMVDGRVIKTKFTLTLPMLRDSFLLLHKNALAMLQDETSPIECMTRFGNKLVFYLNFEQQIIESRNKALSFFSMNISSRLGRSFTWKKLVKGNIIWIGTSSNMS